MTSPRSDLRSTAAPSSHARAPRPWRWWLLPVYALLPREERDAMRERHMEERRRLAAKLDNEFTADPTCPSPRSGGCGLQASAPWAAPRSGAGFAPAPRRRFCQQHR